MPLAEQVLMKGLYEPCLGMPPILTPSPFAFVKPRLMAVGKARRHYLLELFEFVAANDCRTDSWHTALVKHCHKFGYTRQGVKQLGAPLNLVADAAIDRVRSIDPAVAEIRFDVGNGHNEPPTNIIKSRIGIVGTGLAQLT